MVGVGGFEPPASSLSGMRSNQLSYTPEPFTLRLIASSDHFLLVELIGIEPTTS